MTAKLDLVGRVFGRATVIKEHGRTDAMKVTWLCEIANG